MPPERWVSEIRNSEGLACRRVQMWAPDLFGAAPEVHTRE